MQLRAYLLRLATGPVIGTFIAMALILSFTSFNTGLARVYSQACVDPQEGLDADEDNDEDDNDEDEDEDDNDEDEDEDDDNDNGGETQEITGLVSCDAGEAAIGAQPFASDTTRNYDLGPSKPTFTGPDGVLVAQWTGGGSLLLTHDPADPAVGPAAPVANDGTTQFLAGTAEQVEALAAQKRLSGESAIPAAAVTKQIRAANIQLVPLDVPNNVNVTLRYLDTDLGGLPESGLRMFYYDAGLGRWVEVPATIDPVGNTVTWSNVNVGAFAPRITRIAVFI